MSAILIRMEETPKGTTEKLVPGGVGIEARAEASRFTKVAREIGAEVVLEPEWGRVGQVRFKHGGVTYFQVGFLDINLQASARIAKDKAYTAYFLGKAGYPVIPGKTFFVENIVERRPKLAEWEFDRGTDAACRYAESIGYPVIVKPNDGAEGKGVFLARDEADMRAALKDIFTKHETALVQERVSGRDYRVLVFDGDIVAAYERVPLNVVGDGTSTIRTLKKKELSLKIRGVA